MSTRRASIVVVAFLALAASILGAASLLNTYRQGGPLEAKPAAVEFPLDLGQAATWGMVLPVNPTLTDIQIESVEAVEVQGLELLGIVVSHPNVDGSLVNAYGFPPVGIATTEPHGSTLPAVGSSSRELQALIGIRLRAGSSEGSIGGVRIRYTLGGSKYEYTLPWVLKISGA